LLSTRVNLSSSAPANQPNAAVRDCPSLGRAWRYRTPSVKTGSDRALGGFM
jgi:hypothetical protein